MPIEAVTVSVGYGDFLAVAAAENRGLLDRWVVVTTPADEETREVCRRFNLETVLTEEFEREGPGAFAKARGINRGLAMLSAGAWRLHLDADVVLPPTFRLQLDQAHLDEQGLYGCDRVMVRSWQEWQQFRTSGWLPQDYHARTNVPPFPLGTRWTSPHDGYVPIGFFQLWHAAADEWRGIRHRRYPERHGNAARSDVQFGLQWDRRLRHLIPELFVLHLESEPAPLGANWNGRTTRRFGPPGDAGSARGCRAVS